MTVISITDCFDPADLNMRVSVSGRYSGSIFPSLSQDFHISDELSGFITLIIYALFFSPAAAITLSPAFSSPLAVYPAGADIRVGSAASSAVAFAGVYGYILSHSGVNSLCILP